MSGYETAGQELAITSLQPGAVLRDRFFQELGELGTWGLSQNSIDLFSGDRQLQGIHRQADCCCECWRYFSQYIARSRWAPVLNLITSNIETGSVIQ